MTRVLWLAVVVCVAQCLPMSQDELEDFSNFLLKTSSLDIHVKTGADPDNSFDEDEVVSDHAWEESGKFEGDLILNDRQRRLIVENVEGLSRNGLTDSTKRWPNNEVIYFIQKEHFTSGQVQAIRDGIDDLARASCVKFRPYRKGDRDAVVIQGSRRGCFSQVGYQGGYQVLNLSGRHPVGRGCFRHGTVVHELLHSLGFYHMQSSPDRDDYINVVWANIVQPARHNFRKYNSFSVSDFGVGYDYDSVLHYSRRAFSVNGQDTLVPKKSGAEIGQRVGLSDKDTQKLNKMYCDADNDPAVQADENTSKKPMNKKKKPKNQPFEGHGIGYHQGKTVVIKLPAAETYKLPNVPSTPVFDFSKTPQVVPPEAEGYRFGEEVTYSYRPITPLNVETVRIYNKPEAKSIVIKNTEQHDTEEEAEPSNENKDGNSSPQHSNEFKPKYIPIDDYDKDLKDAFDRITNIVKEHIYPQNKDYNLNINKDYSQFFTPLQSQQSDPPNNSLDYKSEQRISYGPSTITPLKQRDTTQTSDNKLRNVQIQDRMDASFRTSLPIKKPYSSFEQTETPNYATLEYLKNRDDFSNLYSLKTTDSNTQVDRSISSDGDKYKEDIKINPYDRGFYTDYVNKNIKDRLTDGPTQTHVNEEEKPSKYELKEKSKQLQLEEGIKDSSYRTSLPVKKPYSAYEHTETPRYATLEYLKDRHDITNIYPPKKSDYRNSKEPNNASEDDRPPTEGDWYIKNSYRHNPANYDRDSYSEYVQPKSVKHEEYDDSDEDKKSTRDSSNKADETIPEYKPVNDDYSENYEKENGKLSTGANFNGGKKKASSAQEELIHTGEHDYDHYGKYEKENDHYFSNEADEEPRKESLNQSHALKYNEDYTNDHEKEHDASSVEASNENKSSKDSPKKNQAYTLYGVPVPLTKEWYKPSYAIPDTAKAGENI